MTTWTYIEGGGEEGKKTEKKQKDLTGRSALGSRKGIQNLSRQKSAVHSQNRPRRLPGPKLAQRGAALKEALCHVSPTHWSSSAEVTDSSGFFKFNHYPSTLLCLHSACIFVNLILHKDFHRVWTDTWPDGPLPSQGDSWVMRTGTSGRRLANKLLINCIYAQKDVRAKIFFNLQKKACDRGNHSLCFEKAYEKYTGLSRTTNVKSDSVNGGAII